MGKTRGFLEYARAEEPYRDELERVKDFAFLHPTPSNVDRRCQAARCMDCGVPFCQSSFGCPLHNLIPEWNDLIFRGQDRAALERLLQTAPFPEFTGRVCPALCEKACSLADDGVTNRDNELYLVETGFARGWIGPRAVPVRTGKRVAVAGSGPAGLAAADRLNILGNEVTVFERADRPGGLLMYGIPNMKLPKEIIARRIRLMEEEGITFLTGTEADSKGLKDFDAVVLCGGARVPRRLNAENADAPGVHFAVDYLTEATRSLLNGTQEGPTACGKHTVVVGGGDTGNDCVATALRQGCLSVTQLEMMPAPPEKRPAGDPWPLWPRVLRTDYGQAEAGAIQGRDPRLFETTVQRILTDGNGEICAVETVRLDEGHRPIPGTEKTLPCTLLLIAAGFVGCDERTLEGFSMTADSRGRLLPGDGSHHLGGSIFSAGDMRTGQSLVVRSIADGREAAGEVHAFLCDEEKN